MVQMHYGEMVHLQGLRVRRRTYACHSKSRKEDVMARKVWNGKKRLVLIGLAAGVLALGLGVAFDRTFGGVGSAHAGIGTSPGMPGR